MDRRTGRLARGPTAPSRPARPAPAPRTGHAGGTPLTDHAAYRFRAYPFPDDTDGTAFRWFVVMEPEEPTDDVFEGASVRLRLARGTDGEEARALADHLNRKVESVTHEEGDRPEGEAPAT